MVNKTKITCLATVSLIVLALGSFLIVQGGLSSAQSSEQNQAYSCLTKVLNIDLSHYQVQAEPILTLPSEPNDNSVTEQVSYNLTSTDSNLLVVFLYKDSALYQLALTTLSGSVVTARNYTNLNDAAVDFLSRYETVSAVDLTPLIRLVATLNSTEGTAHAGNLTFSASSGPLLPGHTVASYRWFYSSDNATVSLDFDNGVFHGFEYFGFTSKDSKAAMNALPSPTQTMSTAVPPNSAVESQPSAMPPQNQENQSEKTLFYIIALLAAVIVAASIVAVYQLRSTRKTKATG
ncbi:MAG: hypothetical protein ACLQO7_13305 [Candidatus Bathyarchaeia archaeon]